MSMPQRTQFSERNSNKRERLPIPTPTHWRDINPNQTEEKSTRFELRVGSAQPRHSQFFTKLYIASNAFHKKPSTCKIETQALLNPRCASVRFSGLRPNIRTPEQIEKKTRTDPCRLDQRKDYVVPTQTWYIEQVKQGGPIGGRDGPWRTVRDGEGDGVSFNRTVP